MTEHQCSAPIVLKEWRTAGDLDAVAQALRDDPPRRLDLDGDLPCHHRVGDFYYARRVAPNIVDLESNVRHECAKHLSETIYSSPFERSSVSIKVYGDGDLQGSHRDSNPVSAILTIAGAAILSTEADGDIYTTPGDLLIFRGKEVRHWVAPVNGERITAVYNFYTASDMCRPPSQDSIVYGDD